MPFLLLGPKSSLLFQGIDHFRLIVLVMMNVWAAGHYPVVCEEALDVANVGMSFNSMTQNFVYITFIATKLKNKQNLETVYLHVIFPSIFNALLHVLL